MKAIKLFVFVIIMFLAGTIQAQVVFNITIGSPPMWGPAGYPDVRYYYLPDVEAYYDVQTSMFIYTSGGSWIQRTSLPARYRNYNLYNGYKVVMSDYQGNKPYTHFRKYSRKYAKGYRGPLQQNIGVNPGTRNSNKEARNSRSKNEGSGIAKNADKKDPDVGQMK